MKLDLDADLVVLSACNTGQGRMTNEGVIGLGRALIAAGAASVLVALRPVRDEEAADLMIRFHRHLANGLGKAQALRRAMLETREEFPGSFDWAAFTLIGEPD